MGIRLSPTEAPRVATRYMFGGSNYPALVNLVMAEVATIARSRGIPVVFLTDDLFTCGSTRE
eukprot:3335-Eustigmatos_ZCMA.PRE.1